MELESYLVVAGYGKRMGEALKSQSGWAQNGNGSDVYGFNEQLELLQFHLGDVLVQDQTSSTAPSIGM